MTDSGLAESDLLKLRLFKAEVGTFIDGYRFNGFLFPINYMEGVHVDFERLAGWVSLNCAKDYENLIARYEAFAEQAKGIVEVLKEGIRLGMTNHAISMVR